MYFAIIIVVTAGKKYMDSIIREDFKQMFGPSRRQGDIADVIKKTSTFPHV